jgi:NADP-dependent 3-hydroxy acid dehydrogenase YdfG
MSELPTALITGASRGIGAVVAESLSGTHDLLLGGRDVEALDALARRFPSARPWPVELTDPAALAAATAGIHRLDALVHCAGIARVLPLETTDVDVWRQTMEINVVSVAELTRLLLPALRAARGHVVLINSGAGLRANPGWGAYAASKFALRAYGDVLRAEEDAAGIKVTSVHPGRVDTDMQRGVRADEGGEYEADRYLRPESVAQAVFTALTAPPDAHFTEIVVRPGRR